MNLLRTSRPFSRAFQLRFATNAAKKEKPLTERAQNTAENTYNKVKDNLTPEKSVGEKVDEGIDKTKEMANKGKDMASKSAQNTKETVNKKAEELKSYNENRKPIGKKVKESLEDAKDYVNEKVNDLKEAIGGR
ncbi:hypothetical protein HDU92_007955 [Lobulomyces angularis]|nr:hypothetical protein HDU92_007955 [Lobulomyces angularis]